MKANKTIKSVQWNMEERTPDVHGQQLKIKLLKSTRNACDSSTQKRLTEVS